jgi:hypothetical protein
MTTNHFELRLTQRIFTVAVEPNSLNTRDPRELELIPSIWIDGLHLDEPHSVSVNAVLQSFAKSNHRGWGGLWHYVFTCGCGTAGCANIDEGVGVVHHDDAVEWVFRRPQSNKFGDHVLGFKKWCETATWHVYRFDRHQVTQELIRFLEEAWLVINTTDMEIAAKNDVLSWFNDDPRYFMRCRSNEWWTSGSKES